MVVGDRILHISRDIVPSFSDVVLSENGERRSLVGRLCVAGEVDDGDMSSSKQNDKPLRSSSKNCSYDFAKVHQECTPASSFDPIGRLDLQLFYASRQTHDEAFLLFWRTTQFCFIDGEPLTDFLACLTGPQEQNLRHLVLFIAIRHLFRAGWYRSWIETYWLACNAKRSEFYSLRHLTGLELHLQLPCSQNYQHFTPEAQKECIQECFEAVGDLCLLPLKTCQVSIRYAEPVEGRRKYPASRNITKENVEGIAQKMRKRLLQPATTEQPFADSLAKKIEKLETSLRERERKTEAGRQTAAVFFNKLTIGSQRVSDESSSRSHEGHVKAKAVEGRIGPLQAVLQDLHT